MMEMLSTGDMDRSGSWTGFFHTLSKDFHRARERETAERNKMLNQMREDVKKIMGLSGRALDHELKNPSRSDIIAPIV